MGLFYCQPIWPPKSKNSLFTLDDHMINIALHGLRNIAEARADSESLADSRQSFREINPFRFERAQGILEVGMRVSETSFDIIRSHLRHSARNDHKSVVRGQVKSIHFGFRGHKASSAEYSRADWERI